ncbi:MAG TPA: alpha/beta hydrolase [Verrucomicrobiae bacterium]|nr:alpha/beta hydrolase [Verrucomicrobiae bacterium]
MNAVDAAAINPPPAEIRLWPGEAPLSVAHPRPERIMPTDQQPPNRHIYHITVPTLTVFTPPQGHNSGMAVVICPGGSYAFLSWDKEGLDVARWLQARGVTGAVLKYRLPAPDQVPSGHLVSLLDAQRAIRLLRERAAEFGIRTNRVGILGFSAGGHLAACVTTKFTDPVPSPIQADQRVSCRPDFCVLAYPVISLVTSTHVGSCTNLLGRGASEQLRAQFSCEKLVTKETPATFLVHARDDTSVPVTNSIMFADACRQAGVPAELHLYETGKHGFGLGVNGGDVTNWPAQLEIFLERFR